MLQFVFWFISIGGIRVFILIWDLTARFKAENEGNFLAEWTWLIKMILFKHVEIVLWLTRHSLREDSADGSASWTNLKEENFVGKLLMVLETILQLYWKLALIR